jgi:hypothetical protein
MKKIITKPASKQEILASDLPVNPLIGAFSKTNPSNKSFVVMTKYYNHESYYLMCREGFEYGNGYGTDEVGPYMGTIEKILQHPSLEFLHFDSPQELFKWLSEGGVESVEQRVSIQIERNNLK